MKIGQTQNASVGGVSAALGSRANRRVLLGMWRFGLTCCVIGMAIVVATRKAGEMPLWMTLLFGAVTIGIVVDAVIAWRSRAHR